MIPGGWGTRAARCAGSTQESPRHAGRGQAGAETQRPPRAAAKLSEEFETGGERSLGVDANPVLQLSLSREAEPGGAAFRHRPLEGSTG